MKLHIKDINFEHMWGRVYCMKCNMYTIEMDEMRTPNDIWEQYTEWLDYHKQGMCKMVTIDQMSFNYNVIEEQPKHIDQSIIKECISNVSCRMAFMVESGKKWGRVVCAPVMELLWLLAIVCVALLIIKSHLDSLGR